MCSLAEFAGDLEEGSLCPVQALRTYLERTKSVPARAATLFVSPHCPSRATSKNSVSYFLREGISGAEAFGGGGGGDEGPLLRAHSIYGVSTSAVFLQNWWSISKMLEAASWRSNSTFASFYFKDVQHIFEGFRSLGPFIAVGSVVNPT